MATLDMQVRERVQGSGHCAFLVRPFCSASECIVEKSLEQNVRLFIKSRGSVEVNSL